MPHGVEASLDRLVLATAVSARNVLTQTNLDPYIEHEAYKVLCACDRYFLFLGKPQSKYTRVMANPNSEVAPFKTYKGTPH